ncbi:STAS domain-containing protein [Streptomyces sp. VRA16 Mangrove soil]|uniref:STAS domain-containing protein n=1 Tax=Streptomyces sp. VRA16 Mangrove soil TaxID=2817434 RepID=UPI001A9D5A5C|nr:STAS domain-containing protein [Streptomyces sp. VRA16 Mangrove soil]MBO1330715.1 STAS domain-containing protein [Streptomyces sp. VRA16 Mangrove soil]
MHITTELHGDRATLTPHGDIDADHVDQLRASVTALPDAVTSLVWDLRDAPFLDIPGLHLFEPATDPVRTTVVNLQPQPLRLLRLAHELFPDSGWERHLNDPGTAEAA